MHIPVVHEPLERGVYIAPHTVGGKVVLMAITSWGERSAELAITTAMPEPKARRILARHLDHIDPLPRAKLRLVRES